jgi:hypothetical protein
MDSRDSARGGSAGPPRPCGAACIPARRGCGSRTVAEFVRCSPGHRIRLAEPIRAPGVHFCRHRRHRTVRCSSRRQRLGRGVRRESARRRLKAGDLDRLDRLPTGNKIACTLMPRVRVRTSADGFVMRDVGWHRIMWPPDRRGRVADRLGVPRRNGPGHLLRREGNADLVLAGNAAVYDGETDEREGGGEDAHDRLL